MRIHMYVLTLVQTIITRVGEGVVAGSTPYEYTPADLVRILT